MNDRERLDEPPPILRSRGVPPASRSKAATPAVPWWRRPSAPRKPTEAAQPAKSSAGRIVALGLVAVAAAGLQGWTVHRLTRLQSQLAASEAALQEARGSLGMLWATTNRLDEDQMVRLALLADSIRSVSAYAQGEIRLWETAYNAQEQRLEARIAGNAEAIARTTAALRAATGRVDALARLGEAQLSRIDALEGVDRTQGAALTALEQRARAQESAASDVNATLADLRLDLGTLDSELVELEEQLASSSSAYVQIDRRIQGLAGWVEGFQRAGLSAEAVQGRLSALTDELRRVRMRVDSMRPVGTAAQTVSRPQARAAPRD